MSSKQKILSAIRRHKIAPVEQLPLDGPWITYDDPRSQFKEMLELIGGKCVSVANEVAIAEELARFPEFQSASQICSVVEGIDRANFDLSAIDDPRALEVIDYAILRGHFAVAENGAVWVTDEDVRHRAIYFATQHLALVVRGEDIVSNMHQAYEKLSFTSPGFGAFISGPSKTADIEQSLVIGAQGPRSLVAFVVG